MHMVSSDPKKRPTTGVLDYLQSSLPRSTLLKLFTEERRGRFVARALVQRALSPLAQQVVMRLACTGGSFPLLDVRVWSKENHAAVQASLVHELTQWGMIGSLSSTAATDSTAQTDEDQQLTLTKEFYQALQESLCTLESSPWTSLSADQIAELEREEGVSANNVVTPEDLEHYTQEQWDAVLHFLVGSTGTGEPPPAVVQFLLQTDLMQPDPDYEGDDQDASPLVITRKGYDFMLQDNYQQVWHFVVQYLYSLESHERGPKLVREALLLLLCLSFSHVGQVFSLDANLNKHGRALVKDLALFGLLYTRKVGKHTLFYPTRVAMQLLGGQYQGSTNAGDHGSTTTSANAWSLSTKALDSSLSHPRPHDSSHLAIIVQTNFQLCAYTTSELHVSMLGLFCEVQTIRRLPNICFMTISRDSVKAAFALGIQAEQILRFLEKHAHPRLRRGGTGAGSSPSVPSNVTDQIWLWDRERHRVEWVQVYNHQCLMDGEFEAVAQYARERGALAWSSVREQELYIDYSAVERTQAFARQWRAQKLQRDA